MPQQPPRQSAPDARLCIYIPSYNASEFLLATVRRIPWDRLPPLVPLFVLFVDNASQDGTQGEIEKARAELARAGIPTHAILYPENRGIVHDIPRTVARAVKSAIRHDVGLLTVHAHGGRDMLRAAAEAAAEAGPDAPTLLAVTTLTSLNESDLRDLGIARSVSDHSAALAEMAVAAGIGGLVCSVHEAAALRTRFGEHVVLVTPGIRPVGTDKGDQKRIATPAAAVKAGANFLVVGRPNLEASDPSAASAAILMEMAQARL